MIITTVAAAARKAILNDMFKKYHSSYILHTEPKKYNKAPTNTKWRTYQTFVNTILLQESMTKDTVTQLVISYYN